jgi:hypothetical protein
VTQQRWLSVFVAAGGVLAFASSNAADTVVVFNHVSGNRTPLDQELRDHFATHYAIIDASDKEHTWTVPMGVGQHGPLPTVYLNNVCISGQTLVAYVISVDGRVVDAYAVKATTDFLGAVAVHEMSERHFAPAQLDGKPVSSLAVTIFRATCPAAGSK